MTDREVTELMKRIAKESRSVSVKAGRTNGKPCLHLKARPLDGRPAHSVTLYSEGEWNVSPLNERNRPRKVREADAEPTITSVTAQTNLTGRARRAVASTQEVPTHA